VGTEVKGDVMFTKVTDVREKTDSKCWLSTSALPLESLTNLPSTFNAATPL